MIYIILSIIILFSICLYFNKDKEHFREPVRCHIPSRPDWPCCPRKFTQSDGLTHGWVINARNKKVSWRKWKCKDEELKYAKSKKFPNSDLCGKKGHGDSICSLNELKSYIPPNSNDNIKQQYKDARKRMKCDGPKDRSECKAAINKGACGRTKKESVKYLCHPTKYTKCCWRGNCYDYCNREKAKILEEDKKDKTMFCWKNEGGYLPNPKELNSEQAKCYLENNPDLQNAFRNQNESTTTMRDKAQEHWVKYGKKEIEEKRRTHGFRCLIMDLTNEQAKCYLHKQYPKGTESIYDKNSSWWNKSKAGPDAISRAKWHWKTYGHKDKNTIETKSPFICHPESLTDEQGQCYLDDNKNLSIEFNSEEPTKIKVYKVGSCNQCINLTNEALLLLPPEKKAEAIKIGMTMLGGAAATYWHHHIFKTKDSIPLDKKLSFAKIPPYINDLQANEFIKKIGKENLNKKVATRKDWIKYVKDRKGDLKDWVKIYWHHNARKDPKFKYTFSTFNIPSSLTNTQIDQFVKENDFLKTNPYWVNVVKKYGVEKTANIYWVHHGKTHPTRKYTFSIPKYINEEQAKNFVENNPDLLLKFTNETYWSNMSLKKGIHYNDFFKNLKKRRHTICTKSLGTYYSQKDFDKNFEVSTAKLGGGEDDIKCEDIKINEQIIKITGSPSIYVIKETDVGKVIFNDPNITELEKAKHHWKVKGKYITPKDEYPYSCNKDEKNTFIYQLGEEDTECYLERYPEIRQSDIWKKSIGTDIQKAQEHWKKEGINQSRDPKCRCPDSADAYFVAKDNKVCCLAGKISGKSLDKPGLGWAKNRDGCESGYRAPNREAYRKSCNNTAMITENEMLPVEQRAYISASKKILGANKLCCRERPNIMFKKFGSSGCPSKGKKGEKPHGKMNDGESNYWHRGPSNDDFKIGCINRVLGSCNSKSHPYLGNAKNVESARRRDRFKTRFYSNGEGFDKFWKCPRRDIRGCQKACNRAKKLDESIKVNLPHHVECGEASRSGLFGGLISRNCKESDAYRWRMKNLNYGQVYDGTSSGDKAASNKQNKLEDQSRGDGNFRNDKHSADVIWGEELIREANQREGYICGHKTDHRLAHDIAPNGEGRHSSWNCKINPRNRNNCFLRKIGGTRVCEQKYWLNDSKRGTFDKLAIYNIEDLKKAGLVNNILYKNVKKELANKFNEKYLIKPWNYHDKDSACRSYCATSAGLGKLTRNNINRSDYVKCRDGCRWCRGADALNWSLTAVSIAVTSGAAGALQAALFAPKAAAAATAISNTSTALATFAELTKVTLAAVVNPVFTLAQVGDKVAKAATTVEKVVALINVSVEIANYAYQNLSIADFAYDNCSEWKKIKKAKKEVCRMINGKQECEDLTQLTANPIEKIDIWKNADNGAIYQHSLGIRNGIPNYFCLPNGATKHYCSSGKIGGLHYGDGYHDQTGQYLRYNDSRKLLEQLAEKEAEIKSISQKINNLKNEKKIEYKPFVLPLFPNDSGWIRAGGRRIYDGRKLKDEIPHPLCYNACREDYKNLLKDGDSEKDKKEKWEVVKSKGKTRNICLNTQEDTYDESKQIPIFKSNIEMSEEDFKKKYVIKRAKDKTILNIYDDPFSNKCNSIYPLKDADAITLKNSNGVKIYIFDKNQDDHKAAHDISQKNKLASIDIQKKKLEGDLNKILDEYDILNQQLRRNRENLKSKSDIEEHYWYENINKKKPDTNTILKRARGQLHCKDGSHKCQPLRVKDFQVLESGKKIYLNYEDGFSEKKNPLMPKKQIDENNANDLWYGSGFNDKLRLAGYDPMALPDSDTKQMNKIFPINKIGKNSIVKKLKCGSKNSGTRPYRCLP